MISLGVVTLILGSVLIIEATRPDEQTYQGKTMTEWFRILPATELGRLGGTPRPVSIFGQGQGDSKTIGPALEALQHFTNAGPFLVRKLQAADSRVETLTVKIAAKLGLNWIPFQTAWAERGHAVTALTHHGTILTRETQESLQSLMTNSDKGIASSATYILKVREIFPFAPRWPQIDLSNNIPQSPSFE